MSQRELDFDGFAGVRQSVADRADALAAKAREEIAAAVEHSHRSFGQKFRWVLWRVWGAL